MMMVDKEYRGDVPPDPDRPEDERVKKHED